MTGWGVTRMMSATALEQQLRAFVEAIVRGAERRS